LLPEAEWRLWTRKYNDGSRRAFLQVSTLSGAVLTIILSLHWQRPSPPTASLWLANTAVAGIAM
jgi:hypothetical protein